MRILIVEDHVDTAALYAAYLRRLGHDSVVAEGADEAVGHCAAGSFDALLVDISLSGEESGWDVVGRLLAACPGAKAVAISGYAGPAAEARSRAAGFAAHLAKPIDLNELDALLARLAGG